MTIYTFYLCQEGGSASSFEAFDLPGDDATHEVAQTMLLQHASCAYVAVWQGERVLGRVRRQGAGKTLCTQSASGTEPTWPSALADAEAGSALQHDV